MALSPPTEPITVRAARDIVSEIDALASAMSRSRNYVVVQAMKHYLEANAWQIERVEAGIAAARDGKVRDSDEVFAGIAAKRGWAR